MIMMRNGRITDSDGIVSRFKCVSRCLVLLIFILAGCHSSRVPHPYQAPAGAASASGRPLTFLSASDLADGIRSGAFSSYDVVAAHINHIHKYNPALSAIVVLDEAGALERARQADEALARGEYWGPLHGVPMSIKDRAAASNAFLNLTCKGFSEIRFTL